MGTIKNSLATLAAAFTVLASYASPASARPDIPQPAPLQARAIFTCIHTPPDLTAPQPVTSCKMVDNPALQKNIDTPIPPASLIKMLTAYMVIRDMESKKLNLNAPFITITAEDNTQSRLGERDGVVQNLSNYSMGLRAGTQLTYGETLDALLIFSANEVAIAAGKALAPDHTEKTFAKMMTEFARDEIKMNATTFKNASGMPATGQLTTARDVGHLIEYLLDHLTAGKFHEYYGKTNATVAGRAIHGHIDLLRNNKSSLRGAKTGTQDDDHGRPLRHLAGYGERDDIGVIVVVLGSPNKFARDGVMQSALNKVFALLGVSNAVASDTPPAALLGKRPTVIRHHHRTKLARKHTGRTHYAQNS